MNMSKVLLVYNLNGWRVICIVNLEVSQCVGAPFTQNLGDGHSVQGSGFVHQIFQNIFLFQWVLKDWRQKPSLICNCCAKR